MVQKKLIVKNLEEFKKELTGFVKATSDIEYKKVVAEIMFANNPEEDVAELQRILNTSFSNLETIGMSAGGILPFYQVESLIIISFTFVREANITSFYKGFDRNSDTLIDDVLFYSRKLRENILQIPNVKAVEIYFAWIKASASLFIDELSKGLEDVPIYGAIANANSVENINDFVGTNNDTVVIGQGNVGPGVSVIVYSGKDLYVYCDYLFGWEPVGKEMDVCACDITNEGRTTVFTIDDMKSTDIYEKYLGVKPDKMFVHNICEFPIIVKRNGVFIGRTPSGFGENGEVYLEGDILPGEKVRFSYGEYDDILNGTKNAAMRMAGFGPESLSLVICGNRIIFLQSDYHLEFDFYSEGRDEEPLPILGMGEIYRYKGQGGILNSALVATGMREGLGTEKSHILIKQTVTHHHNDFIPLSERLSHFLKAVTGELVEAAEDAQAANEAKSAFLSNMSHEIRTPINAVLGMDEMILRESTENSILEYAEAIRSAGNSLLGIINDILDFSKIEAGKMEIVPVEYDVASILNDLVNMIKKRADDKNLELVVKVDSKIPHLLYGDEIRLKQVATNILTNAVKYTEKGSITLSVDITRIDGDDIILRYSVKDTGIGIKEEDLPKLFSAFERIEEKRNRSIEGTGLGMSITQHLLKMMGSELKVDSVYGEGSDFYFDITQKIIDAEPLGDYDTALKRSISVRKEYKESFTAPDAEILVVDDTEINLTVIKNLLKKTLVKIDTAQSGDECLMMMRQKKYDMVFLDHRMPGKDGIETLSEIKKDKTIDGDLPIIALTANAVSGSRDIYINAGFTDYLSKPIQTDILEGIICKFLPADKVKKATISEQDDVGNDSLEIIPEIIRHSSLFDIKKAIANCGSSQGLMDALRSYYDSYQDNSRQIKDYYDSESFGNYTTKVHALKSSSRIVGLMELGNLAESLEKAGNEGDLSFIKKSTDKLLVMYREATALLAKIFEKAEDDSKKEVITPNKLKEAYTAMKEIAQMFDYDSILMVLDSIEKYKMPDDEKERFEDLKSAIRNADWDQIISILG